MFETTHIALTPTVVDITELYLDLSNPRFWGHPDAPVIAKQADLTDSRAQELTRRHLVRHHSVTPLIESIARLGFLTTDRIIVKKINTTCYVVVEGNRRLAALKTIWGDLECKAIELPGDIIATLSPIEVLVLPDAQSTTMPFVLQGLRHISGVKNWGPFQQGKLIYTLVKEEGLTLREAALTVGLSPSRVSALLRGYCGLAQFYSRTAPLRHSTPSLFSCFEQAYAKIPVREWLGWVEEDMQYTNTDRLDFFYSCIAPSGQQPPRLIARNIRDHLPEVVTNANALQRFMKDKLSIYDAYLLATEKATTAPLVQSAVDMIDITREFTKNGARLDEQAVAILQQLHNLTGSLLNSATAEHAR